MLYSIFTTLEKSPVWGFFLVSWHDISLKPLAKKAKFSYLPSHRANWRLAYTLTTPWHTIIPKTTITTIPKTK